MRPLRKEDTHRVFPVVPLRGMVMFPYMTIEFDFSRKKSIAAFDAAVADGSCFVMVLAQKNFLARDVKPEDLYEVGTLALVTECTHLSDNTVSITMEGVARFRVKNFVEGRPYLACDAEIIDYFYCEVQDLRRQYAQLLRTQLELFHKEVPLTAEALEEIGKATEAEEIADLIAGHLPIPLDKKQELLEVAGTTACYMKVTQAMRFYQDIHDVEQNIEQEVHRRMEENQREYYLREQLRAVQLELDGAEGMGVTVKEYREKFEGRTLPQEVTARVEKELSHLARLQLTAPEAGVIMGYLDCISDLPWDKTTEEVLDLARAKACLDADHYGLEKVKDRILESLAARKHAGNGLGDILCLVGPPGVGKSSVAESVARALNRNFVRVSLGGVHDEAEIRGHRRTYIGSMCGRILSGYKQAGSKNPLMLLDEIDKMASDFRGDPASAMLEVLDPAHQESFRDHYLDLPFDLSQTMFITTANTVDTIPKPLLDRMEVIHIDGYTPAEKEEIALRHLIPRLAQKFGVEKKQVTIPLETVRLILSGYTREAGVRLLEQHLAKLFRKSIRLIEEGTRKQVTVRPATAQKMLGAPPCPPSLIPEKDEVGVAVGLAWTAAGGEVLTVEVNAMEGTGKVELTGSLGDVMKESATAAVSFVRAHAAELGVPADFYRTHDLHIHVPEGATPKDGPSAGITIATAVTSALSGRPVRRDVAMTGEITLRGRVLPIGGLKEKSMAAYLNGIQTVVLPKQNTKDLAELPDVVRQNLRFVSADTAKTVLKTALR